MQRRYEPQYNAPGPRNMDDSLAPSPEPFYKNYPQPFYSPKNKSPPGHVLQPTKTMYGYADPRHVPPGPSPEPSYRQYEQPKYPHSNKQQQERNIKSSRPKEVGRHLQAGDPYAQKKFDYQLDGRFHHGPPQHESYDRSPRQEYRQPYDSTPRNSYQEPYGNTPRNAYQEEINRHNEPMQSQKRAEYEEYSRQQASYDVNKGYLVMMRFLATDLAEVITAIQENIGIIDAHSGYVIGFSVPKHMAILVTNNDMLVHEQWWDPRFNSRYGVCCFWFKDVYSAKRWFESGKRLNQPDFPNSHAYEVVAVPLTYGRNKEPAPFSPSAHPVTILWCEFPNIFERYHNDFLENYSEPARRIMKEYGGNPHISVTKFKAGWPEDPNKFGQPGYARYNIIHERYARAIKRGWTKPETFISVSAFPSMEAVIDFFKDRHYQDIRSRLDNYSSPVFVAMTLTPVQGTKKYR